MEQNVEASSKPQKNHRKTMKVGGAFATIGTIGSAVVGMFMPTGMFIVFGAMATVFMALFSALGVGTFGNGMKSLFSFVTDHPGFMIFGILVHIIMLAVMILCCVFEILMLKKKNENSKKSVIIGMISAIVILVAPYITTAILAIVSFFVDSQLFSGDLSIFGTVLGLEIGAMSIYWMFGGVIWIVFLVLGFIFRFLWACKWSKTEN